MQGFWPHQIYGVQEVRRLMAAGQRRICLCSPTGGGKSKMMVQLAEDALRDGKRVLQLASRKWLLDQLYKGLTNDGFDVRQMRSGIKDIGPRNYTLASIPTLAARDLMPEADVILVDEAHMNKADRAADLLNRYHDNGGTIIGVTATPLEISHLYDNLILAGSRSDLRKCGALVPALVYSCGEMDTEDIKRTATGEFNLGEIRKKIWTQAIYARVIEEHVRVNPELRPAILFAPGVEESIWFVDQYAKRGIRAAHIDGEDVYCDGVRTTSNQERRDDILDQLRAGDIKVVCNRFVMREGLDIPELFHLILATPVGSILSHTQIVGRVLRNHSSLPTRDFGDGKLRPYCVITDHGGNWWRHPSPNADMEDIWRQYYRCGSAKEVTDERMDALRNGEESQGDPLTKEVGYECPACHAVQDFPRNGNCYSCGFDMKGKRRRTVIQRDGSLQEVTTLPVKRARKANLPDVAAAFERAYWAAKRKNASFRQAAAWIQTGHMRGFEHLRGCQIPKNLPFMPANRADMSRLVQSVPMNQLIRKNEGVQQ
jgi:superfamily II DNA or RNA helicase